ncbi:MAG: amino acid adenylation domain-containing protein [Verrucomicrobia bacterium]|nr:amino acid adenylation domain-containing protein [Verrucomicrobiota bacterium]
MIVGNETPATRRPELSAAKQALLERRLRGESRGVGKRPTISRCAPSTGAPLSFAQQRLWFFNQLDPASPLYNMPTILRLQGQFNFEAFEQALDRIVARHESLRTRFLSTDDGPIQVIDPPSPFRTGLAKLSDRGDAERNAELQSFLAQECRRPFDLTRDRLLRASIARLGELDHVLVLNMHHIVSDGWSWGVFFRELTSLYEASANGCSADLPELPIQYADFAVWQRQWLQGDILQKQLGYWRKRLADAPDFLELPTDFPRSSSQTFRGQWQSLPLSGPLSEAVKVFSRREGVTVFMTLLAAFKTLLWRYTQQDDILVGCPIAGRNHVETEPLIGFFINTLVLRTSVSGNLTFRELLRQVREMTLEAYGNQDLPFEKLVEALRPDRNPAYSPLIQVMFALQSGANFDLKLPGLSITRIEAATGTAKFDLTLSVDDLEAGLVASMEYNTDLFEEVTITRMLEHYRNLVEAVTANPALRLAELPLLSAAEERRIIVEWNDTKTPFPERKCVHELFEEQAGRTPAATAVIGGELAWNYRQLNDRANQLAHYLRRMGVGPEVCVGILLPRSLEMIAAWLAVVKAGGVYVPLDPAYPQARLKFMIRDTRAPVLLTQSSLTGQWQGESLKVLCLDEPATMSQLSELSTENPANQTTSGSSIYVIYTSGSTGEPKGARIPHRAVNRLFMETNYVRLTESDVMAQISNSSFDAATFEVWGSLLHGAQLVIVPQNTLLSPRDFAEEIQRRGITAMFVTAALFNQMSREAPGLFRNVKHVLAGGEALTPRCVADVLRNGPPERLLNGYGPTETTTFAVCQEIKEVADTATSVPIGRPIANTQAYILDPNLKPVPVGVYGELFIGGPGLALGYLNQPEFTAWKFIPNPFSIEPGARLYRTGDQVRYRSNGEIEFLGRLDNQVKIRGFRVELGEVEAVLRQHPSVKDCVVVISPDETGEKRLLAYVIPNPGATPSVNELRRCLQTKLPDYMIPSAIGFLGALPLTPNGKVNRRALPALETRRAETEKAYVAPRDEVEREVVRIWETVLGVRPIGATDKFFELGGHSLLAVRMIGLIERTFGRKLRLAAVFECPTVERLANLLREQAPEGSGSALVEIQPKGSKPPLILVHGVGGGMFWGYTNLSRHLGPDQPVYGIKSRGMDGSEEFGTIEEMAGHYVNELRAFQPQGPYCMGGYCFGGDVAYEMARQLQAQGREVALLVLLDCSAPNSSYDRVEWTPAYTLRFLKNLFDWTRNFMQLSSARRKEYVGWKLRTFRRRFAEGALPEKSGRAGIDVEALADLSSYGREQRALWEAHIRALIAYHPKPYRGRVVLFRTRGHPPFCSFDPRNGWEDFITSGLEIRRVPGVHESMLEEPHVQALANEVRLCLEEDQHQNPH